MSKAQLQRAVNAKEAIDVRRQTMAVEIWDFRETVTDVDLNGFHVEALDGEIGKVDEATYEAGSGLLIVDTGPLVFGRKVFSSGRHNRAGRRR
jgi:hypothetical protein